MPSMATALATAALSGGGCGEGSCLGFSPTYSTAVSTCKAMASSRASFARRSSRVS